MLKALPEFVEIPAGAFCLGGVRGDKFVNSSELPRVRIQYDEPFQMSHSPVTVQQWNTYLDATHQAPHSEMRDLQADWPVVWVSWLEVTAYCEWLSEQLGRRCRLPTEAEWEYAAKAGSESAFSTGANLQLSQANYLYSETGSIEGMGQLTVSGAFAPNPWGLYDMHGNVNEWCLDPWQSQHAATQLSPNELLQDRASCRVVKGGSWDYPPRLLRSSWRDFYRVEQRLDNLGFRITTTL